MSVGDVLKTVSNPIEMRNDEVYRLVSIRRRHGGMFDRERLPGVRILTKDLSRAEVGAFAIAKRQVVHGATCIVPPEFRDAALASSYAQLVGTELCHVEFFAKLAQLPAMTNAFYDASQGVVVEKLTLSLSRWLRTKINLPPLPEQQRISEILDTVDEAIRKTEEIIAKLKQVKQGLLHDLLTRGIDDNGELRDPDRHPEQFKDSPLGRIPKGWERHRLLNLVTLPSGQLDPCIAPHRDWPLVAPDHIESATGRLLAVETAAEQGAISGKYGFEPGDVLYSKIRPYLRKAVLATFRGLCSADMYPLRPHHRLSPRFLLAAILGEPFSQFAETVSMRSGFPKINRKELGEYILWIPTRAEQNQIAAVLVSNDRRQAQEEAELSKLHLLKQGLMEDLLKGRVSVSPLLAERSK
ncbi:MAG: restriction endonuclease subunit S [Myxococcota bacterium]